MTTEPGAWIGLAIALAALANFPGMSDVIRYTLLAVIALVLLRNSPAIATGLNRFTAALGGRPGAAQALGPRPV